MQDIKSVNIRDFQHNLSMYLDLVKLKPLVVTRKGVTEAVFIDPSRYEFKEKTTKDGQEKQGIMKSAFIGMYKNRKDWKAKSNSEISNNLRRRAWYGS